MSDFLPASARPYIDDTDKIVSIQRLTAAIATGDVDIGVLKTYVDATAAGRLIRFQQTKPVSLIMLEHIRAHPNQEPRRIIYQGLTDKLWTWEDVEQWETNNLVLSNARKTSVSRSVYLTRKRRVRRVLPKVSDQFVPRMSMDVICHRDLPDGAKACLAALLSLAGKKDEIVTFTSSIATMLGRTPRTVRNYFIALEECGLIERRPGSDPNTVHIKIKSLSKPEPYQEPKDITAYRMARRSANPALREMAETVAAFSWKVHQAVLSPQEGRKVISAFNLNSKSKERTAPASAIGPTTYSNFRPQMKSDRTHWNPHRPITLKQDGDEADGSRTRDFPHVSDHVIRC
jgi:predicted transcriptional regulator